jgi:hypothetical protein
MDRRWKLSAGTSRAMPVRRRSAPYTFVFTALDVSFPTFPNLVRTHRPSIGRISVSLAIHGVFIQSPVFPITSTDATSRTPTATRAGCARQVELVAGET